MKLILVLLIGLFAVFANQSFAQEPIYIQNTSGPTACDGSALLDSSFVYTSIVWMSNGAVIQQGGNYVGNLCAGSYIVNYSTAQGISSTLTFTIGSGTTNPCSGYGLTTNTTDASTATSCDGMAAVSVVNGSAPFTYQWTGGGAIVNPNALCVGTYSVCVTDANGCVACENVTIFDSSSQPDSILIFSNNNFPGTPVAGVLSTASVEDCTIDYQNVGAAGVTSSVQIGTDTVMVTWTLWDTLGIVVSTYTIPYYVPANAMGLYSLALVVYCSQKSTTYNTIEINDHVMLSSNSITAIDQSMFKVINPMTDELTVIFAEQSSGTIAVLDASGKRVFSSQLNGAFKSTFDVSKLTAGVYMLEAVVNGKVYRTKLIK
jgi:hypothetical protein